MCKYVFYYDETEHSRKITYKTLAADNYYDSFVTAIVGWQKGESIRQRFDAFETKYIDRKNGDGEIKSTILKQKKFQYGFASLDKQNVALLDDFLSIFNEETHVYLSSYSKIEYLITQLFKDYKNNLFYNADILKYIITKAIVMYQPKEVEKCICEKPEDLVKNIKLFLEERIEYNENKNPDLKENENVAFKEFLLILESVSDPIDINWDYHAPFYGFNKYLKEKNIYNYKLIIDKEGIDGENSKTLNAAIKMGLINSEEGDSKENFGIRMADFLAGIISKLMKGLKDSLHYNFSDDGTKKKILSEKWFDLNKEQLELYKKLYRIICLWQPAWYKTYVGIYSDDFISFIVLLSYMNGLENGKNNDFQSRDHGENFNRMCLCKLNDFYERLRNNHAIEPIDINSKDYFFNRCGAKVFIDYNRQPILKLNNLSQEFEVLSIGINSEAIPLITILENDEPMCYRLPCELQEWAMTVVGFSMRGEILFPSKVIFSIVDNKYFADII